jgi:Lon protease-like protein
MSVGAGEGYDCGVSETVALNFGEPIAVFPLPGVVMLPHAAAPLHIFEPRYRRMVEDAIGDGTKPPRPIAVASIDPAADPYDRLPPVREAVCVGHIVRQHRREDGSFDIVLHGLCRAAIDRLEPATSYRPYLIGHLHAMEDPTAPVKGLGSMRRQMRSLLAGPRLQRLFCVRAVMEWIDRPELSDHGAIELVAFAVIKNDGVRYKVLAEGDPYKRARIVWTDLERTDRLLAKAQQQVGDEPPRGVSWN